MWILSVFLSRAGDWRGRQNRESEQDWDWFSLLNFREAKEEFVWTQAQHMQQAESEKISAIGHGSRYVLVGWLTDEEK